MERYEPEVPANITEVKDLLAYVVREHQRIANSILNSLPSELPELNAPPAKPREFMVVAADGTNWNPVAGGRGVYTFYSGAWHKLG